MPKRADNRSAEAKEYRKLYSTREWKDLRASILKAEPLCRMCAEMGDITAASVVDHIKNHKGDVGLFFDIKNLQPLCKPCHDRHASRRDHGRDIRVTALDGWPAN